MGRFYSVYLISRKKHVVVPQHWFYDLDEDKLINFGLNSNQGYLVYFSSKQPYHLAPNWNDRANQYMCRLKRFSVELERVQQITNKLNTHRPKLPAVYNEKKLGQRPFPRVNLNTEPFVSIKPLDNHQMNMDLDMEPYSGSDSDSDADDVQPESGNTVDSINNDSVIFQPNESNDIAESASIPPLAMVQNVAEKQCQLNDQLESNDTNQPTLTIASVMDQNDSVDPLNIKDEVMDEEDRDEIARIITTDENIQEDIDDECTISYSGLNMFKPSADQFDVKRKDILSGNNPFSEMVNGDRIYMVEIGSRMKPIRLENHVVRKLIEYNGTFLRSSNWIDRKFIEVLLVHVVTVKVIRTGIENIEPALIEFIRDLFKVRVDVDEKRLDCMDSYIVCKCNEINN